MAAIVWRYVSMEEIACIPREHAKDTRNAHEDWKCGSFPCQRDVGREQVQDTRQHPNYPGYAHVLTRFFPRAHREGSHPVIFPPGSNRSEGGSEKELDGLEIIRPEVDQDQYKVLDERSDEGTSSAMI